MRLSDPALKRLAPRLAQAISSAEPLAVLDDLSEDDRLVLTRARASARRWIALADRLPPAELVDLVLHESAYAFELHGAGHVQARENLKKLRGLVRRLQNRGYATLGRVAERVSQLMAGDESNAIVDALDAVNLMTVHAAKGLEFPVVFVVNLSRGTGGRGEPVAVVARVGADGEPDDLVSIDGLVEDARDEIDAREREENKRLVYVALTRARDRLYLATTLTRHGEFAPAPTALGAVLPASFHPLFAAAANGTEDTAAWTAASGASHVCRLVRAAALEALPPAPPEPGRPDDDFAPLAFVTSAARNVSDLARAEAAPAHASTGAPERATARAIGALVHRAVAAGALSALPGRRAALVTTLGSPGDEEIRTAALQALDRLAARPDLQALLAEPDVQHEVALVLAGAGWHHAQGGGGCGGAPGRRLDDARRVQDRRAP